MYTLSSGTEIRADATPFARGGEGELYRIQHPPELRDYVLKLYHPDKRTPERQCKTEYLCAHPPVPYTPGYHTPVVWPSDWVMEDGRFAGLIMPLAIGEKLEILCGMKLQPRFRQEWGRFGHEVPESRTLRLKLCFNIAVAVQRIHAAGRYALTDLKPENIMIQTNGLISLVDMDSVEVAEEGKLLFPSHVATPEFTPAEYYRGKQPGRDSLGQAWDLFGLGAIFYKLLLGIHPYSGNSHQPPYHELNTLEDMIRVGLFPHGDKSIYMGVVPAPHRQFQSLPGELRDLFIRCFEGGHTNPGLRPGAEEWCAALAEVLGIAPPAALEIKLLEAEPPRTEIGQPVRIRWSTNKAALVYIEGFGLVPPEGEAEIPASAGLALTAWDEDGRNIRQALPLEVTQPEPWSVPPVQVEVPRSEKKRFRILAGLYAAFLLIAMIGLEPVWQFRILLMVIVLGAEALIRYRKSAYRLEYYALQEAVDTAEKEHARLSAAFEEVSRALAELNAKAKNAGENLVETLQRLQQEEGRAARSVLGKRDAVRKKIGTLSAKYNKLRAKEDAALIEGFEEAKEKLRLVEMRRFGLLFQNIEGLTSADLDRLLEAGITSAADMKSVNPGNGDIILTDGRRVHIRNIGPVKARILHDWLERVRVKVEARLPSPIPFPGRDIIREQFREQAADLQSRLEVLQQEDNELRHQLYAAREKDRSRQRIQRDRTLSLLRGLMDDEVYHTQAGRLRKELVSLSTARNAAREQVLNYSGTFSGYTQPSYWAFVRAHFR